MEPEDETEEEYIEFEDEDVDDDDLTTPPPVIEKYEPSRPPAKKKKKTAGLSLPDGDPSDEPLPLPPEAALAAMKGTLGSRTVIDNIPQNDTGKELAYGVVLNDDRLREMIQDGIEKSVVDRGIPVDDANRDRLLKLVRGELAARIKDFEAIRGGKAGLSGFDKPDLEKLVRSLENQIGDYKTLLAAKGGGGDDQELDTLRRQIKNLEDHLADAEERSDENREKAKRLEKRESDIREELELKKWDIQLLKDETENLKARIAELEALLAQKGAPSVNDDALKADIDRFLEEIQTLRSRNGDLDAAYQALLIDHTKAAENVKKAADRIETANKTNAELKEQAAGLTNRATTAEDAVRARDSEIADLRRQLNARSAAADGNVQSLLNDLSAKDGVIASLNSKVGSLEALKRELAQRGDDADSRAASLAKDLADARAALEDRTAAAKNAANESQKAKSENDA